MREIIIDSGRSGQRLDKFLRKYLPEAGNGFLYKMLRKKNITLNNKRAEGNELLQPGDVVKLFLSEETLAKFAPARDESGYLRAYERLSGISVIREEADILILNKPAGILTQKAEDTDLSLNEWMVGYLLRSGEVTTESLRAFRPSVCNRLDRNTSGLVLCGKTLAGAQYLSRCIRMREVGKFYRTVCVGEIRDEIRLEGFLRKDAVANKVSVSSRADGPDAQEIRTICRPLSANGAYTLLEVELITGKTHQIRAHLADIGHPVAGDFKYGDRAVNERLRSQYGLTGQLLHAYRIVLPEEGEVIAPHPERFERIVRGLGLI